MKATEYIGKKWVSGAKGPEEFDCWGMVQHWFKENLGQDLPDFPATAEDVLAVARTFRDEQKAPQWKELSGGVKNCIVAMGKNSKITHAGVYLGDNLILHCSRDAGRCVIQPTRKILSQWKTVKYYVPNN